MKSALVVVGVLAATASTASADAYLRVIAQKATVHSGPGPSYRTVAIAERGQVFTVVERATRDYWFKIELDDGTTGWILGDMVFPFEVSDDEHPGVLTRMGHAVRGAILGPSPVPYANVGLAASAGTLGGEGIFIMRPSWLIDEYWALEGFAGLSPRSDKEVYLGGLACVLRLAPGSVIGPYASLGLGAAHISPAATNFVDPRETLMAMAAGGGLEITLKKQITLRLDARNWSLFNQNHTSNAAEYTGGLAIFF